MTKNSYSSNILLATASVGTAFAWMSAWLTGLIVDPGTWPMRYILLGIGFVLVVLLVKLWMRQIAKQQKAAQHYFEGLCRLDARDLTHERIEADLTALSESNPWYDSAQRLKDAFVANCDRALEAEHVRTSIEVRSQRLTNEWEQMKAILDALNEPVIAIDNFDEIVLANPSARELFEISNDEGEEKSLQHLVQCEALLELMTDTRRRKTPTQRSAELELGSEEGQKGWYRITTNCIPATTQSNGDDTRSHGAVAVLRDISGDKAAQKRNAEFVSSVSHEMKTPLSGIKAYVELLADGDAEDDETREEFLNVINTQTDRLQRLIDNLLNLARIEAGVVNVSKQSRSLNELLEEAFHVVHPSAEAKNIHLVCDLSPMYLGVLADRDMITQSAINLLSNAIKYTPEGGTVTLRSRMGDNEIEFEVEDTGVGLNEEDCQKVFEKFYRVRKDRKMAQGTGLGLPLAKHIVEDVHGGRLTVESEEGQGSTFKVRLPNAGQLTSATALC